TNSIGTAYGPAISFTTVASSIPTGVTLSSISYGQTTASGNSNIISDGGATITSRGVCWSNATSNPTIINSKTVDGTGIGEFTSSLSGLTPSTTYYTRAYATNSVGTTYSPTMSFTTVAASIPTGLITTTITSITQTMATGGGNSTGDGGAAITLRGVCWSNTTSSPTITNSKTVDGSGIGSFTSSLTGLTTNTTYYVRAYATNSVGTAYGPAISVRTLSTTIPTGVTTNSVTSITQTAATAGGNSISDGGAAITSRGVCWSNTTSSPTINNSKTVDGTGIGTFTSSLAGLSANTTYYVRAYATNSAGTAYSSVTSFNTLASSLAVGQSYQGGIIA
ncbi:MAG: hypothetical protein QMB11_02580, partial [Nonlabens sp.]|uniref:hypothetical protein n=1 Tax=Nonlabens sp. TaxID=1888209 RepID=UPI0035A5BBB5